jgi:hypothetical protein
LNARPAHFQGGQKLFGQSKQGITINWVWVASKIAHCNMDVAIIHAPGSAKYYIT